MEVLKKLFIESDMESAELIELAGGKVVVYCRRCPGKEQPNDDSAAIVQTQSGGIVLVIADGVGGCPGGHQASAIAVTAVAERALAAPPESELRTAILDGIEHANREILALAIGAATTLAVVEIQDGSARVYQVGDSTTLIIGQRGALRWKSTSHSPVGYAIESGMLDEADAMHHDERHVVSNLVGTDSMHIEVGPILILSPRDTIIVGSDGLYDNLHLNEVIQHGRCGKLPKRIAAMADLATKRMTQDVQDQPGKPDDLSMIIFAR